MLISCGNEKNTPKQINDNNALSALKNGTSVDQDTNLLILNTIERCNRKLNSTNLDAISVCQSELEQLNKLLTNNNKEKYSTKIQDILSRMEQFKSLDEITLLNSEEVFYNAGNHEISFVGIKGDEINVILESDEVLKQVELFEEKSKKTIKKAISKIKLIVNQKVKHTDVHTIKFKLQKSGYISVKVTKTPSNIKSKYSLLEIKRDSIIVPKETKNSKRGSKIKFETIFNEPRKYILAGHLRSGTSSTLIPIEVPSRTKEFIYSLRVSESGKRLSEDGELMNDINESYTKIKMLGLPLWESSSSSSSITRELINAISPPTQEEEATVNITFYKNKMKLIKNKRDVDNSAQGTQSRNGLVKSPDEGHCYIQLTTNSTWDNTNVWLDIVALYEERFFYEIRKSLK